MKKMDVRPWGLMAVASLAVAGGAWAADWVFEGTTARVPTVQVDISPAGEIDTRGPQEFDLEGCAFTSYAPCGLTILIR